jgi:hypothetical protein
MRRSTNRAFKESGVFMVTRGHFLKQGSEGTPQTPSEILGGVANLLSEVAREFPAESSVPGAKLRLAIELLNDLKEKLP